MDRLRYRAFLSGHVFVALFVVWGTAGELWAQEEHPVIEATGFQQNRDYSSLASFENIDTLSGGLILTFTDLALPGNAGRHLRFQRTYNSKKGGRWTFGVAGIAMHVADGSGQLNETPEPQDFTPVLLTADGGRRIGAWLNQPVLSDSESLRWSTTTQFWRYDRTAQTVFTPDGARCVYERIDQTLLQVTECADAFGNRITFSWSATALEVTQHVSPTQTRVVHIEYDVAGGFPTSMTFAGRTWTYNGVVSVQPPEGPPWEFTSESSPSRLTVKTPHGGIITYTFEAKEFWAPNKKPSINPPVTELRKYLTQVVQTRETSGTLPAGRWAYGYDIRSDGLSFTTTMDRPDGSRVTYLYGTENGSGVWLDTDIVLSTRILQVSQTGPEIERENLDYRVIPVVAWCECGPLQLESRTVTRTVNGQQRTYTTQHSYDTASFGDYHNPRTITETGDDGRQRVTARTYEHHDRPGSPFIVGLVTQESVTADGGTFTTSRAYEASTGFMTSQTAYGIQTTFSRDQFGNVGTATKANGKSTSFAYDWGVLSSIQTAQHTTTRVINPEGTVAAETKAGRTTSFTYDNLFRVKTVQPPGPRNEIRTDYSAGGTTVTTTRGGSSVVTTLDGFGRPVETVNSVGIRTRSVYDAQGRKIQESYPFTNTDIHTTIEYDPLGRVTKRTNPGETSSTIVYGLGTMTLVDEEQRQTVHTLQAFGDPNEARLIAVTDAAGKTWHYTYNGLGKLTSADAADDTGEIVRTWAYFPGTDRLQTDTHPESGSVGYQYDSAGNLSQKTDANGQTFAYTYDANDRLERIVVNDQHTIITYEPGTDNRESVIHRDVTTRFRYDAQTGRLQSRTVEIDGEQFEVVLEYDANDYVTGLWYPSGRHVGYTPDSEGRITDVVDLTASRNYATNITYHPSGAVTSFNAGNGIPHTFTYDPQRYWPHKIDAGLLSLTYEDYDRVGNVRRIVDSRSGYTQTFAYDVVDRLTTAQGFYGSLEYRYDVHGNRTTTPATTYVYDSSTLRLMQQDGRTFTYDYNGNLSTEPNRGYTYTPFNMIETVTGDGASTYAYDGDQWRVKKVVGPDTTIYIRGANNELLTEWTNPTVTPPTFRDYIYAGNRLLAVVKQP